MASKHSKWRASERAKRPFLPFSSDPLHRFGEGISADAGDRAAPLFARCHSKVEMAREVGAFVPLRLCLPENERAKVSLIIVAALRARREASCLPTFLVVLLQLRWSFVRLSTSRGERDTNNNVLKETGRSDRRKRRRQLFRVLREKQSLCGLGRIEAAHRGFQRRARGFHVGQTNRTGAGVRLKCETKRRCRQTGEEGGENLLISSNRFT